MNLSSRSGLVGVPLAAAYAASRVAIRNHTKSVALYAAWQGLRMCCDAVHPAASMTPMWEAMLGAGPGRAEREAAFVRDTPLRHFGGAPAEVVAVVVHLASDESACTTGSEMVVDGGLLAGSAVSPALAED